MFFFFASTAAIAYERSCSAYLTAVVPNGDRIMLAAISGKGQHSNANKAREEGRDRAYHCFSDLLFNSHSYLGARYAAQGPASCRTSNISGFDDTEVDIETKIRIAACTTYRHLVQAGFFKVGYEITTYGGNFCGIVSIDLYAASKIQFYSNLYPKNFCEFRGFNFTLPY